MEKGNKSIFRNRNFTIFYIGNVVSQIGSMFIQFATGLFILDLTGKAVFMSVYLAITFAIFIIFQPVFGALADRLNKAKLISLLDYIFGTVELLFVLVLFIVKDTNFILGALFLNGVLTSIIAALYQPTSSSMVPLVTKENELTTAYSYISILNSGQEIAGIILASFLYMIMGFKWLLLFDAITYIIAAFFEMFIKVEDNVVKDATKSKLFDDVKEGFKYMSEKKELINMAKIAVMMNIFMVGIFSITLPYMINTDLNLDPIVLGTMNGVFSGGGLIMATIISKKEIQNIGNKLASGFSIIVVSVVGITISYSLMSSEVISLFPFALTLGLCMFLTGIAGSYIQIPLNISYAKRVEEEYMGRVMAIRFSLSSVATPLAMVLFGVLIDHGGVNVALIVGVIGTAGATLFTRSNRYVKAL